MSAGANADELRTLMDELKSLLGQIESKLSTTQPRTHETLRAFKELERVVLRYLTLARRLGLPEPIGSAIGLITRLVVVARQASISINLLMASNPVTAALGIAGLATTAISMTDAFAGY